MGVDYSIQVFDWEEFLLARSHICTHSMREDEQWDFVDQFNEKYSHDYNTGTEFEHCDYSCSATAVHLAEAFQQFRDYLPAEQNGLWYHFLGTLLPDEFGCIPDLVEIPPEVDLIEIDESMRVILNPDSVSHLYETWDQLNPQALADIAELAIKPTRFG